MDPVSDPDTATLEMLPAAYGHPNYSRQDLQTYCAHGDFGYTGLRGQDRNALAIGVGAIAGKHLPERFIQLTAAALFLTFGVGMLVDGILPAAPIPVVVGSAVAVVVLFAAVRRALPKRLRPAAMRTEPAPLTAEPGSGKVPDVR